MVVLANALKTFVQCLVTDDLLFTELCLEYISMELECQDGTLMIFMGTKGNLSDVTE